MKVIVDHYETIESTYQIRIPFELFSRVEASIQVNFSKNATNIDQLSAQKIIQEVQLSQWDALAGAGGGLVAHIRAK